MKTVVVIVALLAAFTYASQFEYFIRPIGMNKTGQVVFTPAKLPCSYVIKLDGQQFQKDNRTSTHFNQRIAYDGDMLSLFSSFSESQVRGLDIIRTDLKHTEQGNTYIPLFSGYGTNKSGECKYKDLTESEANKEIKEVLAKFTEKSVFDGVRDTVFRGKKCKLYHTDKEEEKHHLRVFVDNKNFIVGVWEQQQDETLLTFISYDFNVTMNLFALNREEFPGCGEKAYSYPKDQCK